MKAILLDEAERDVDELFDYLERVERGLGNRLYADLLRAIDLIECSPRIYAKVYKNYRLCPLHSFKYGCTITFGSKYLFIHAVVDLRQKPANILRLLRSR